ncbi:GntR family transcriptional regulator [Mesorhizobium sp. BHbdii]
MRADQIAEILEERIFDGTIADGERLDQVSLAEEFAVSRTPIREALQKLVSSGLAELHPHRGVFVREPSPVELMEMFDVMAELEGMCGRLASERISDAALAELRAANAACEDAAARNSPDDYYRANERFHRIIYRASANSFLDQQATALHRRLKPFRRMQLRLRGRIGQSFAEHCLIVDAISSDDAEAASMALKRHVAVQGAKFQALIAVLRR